MKKSHNTWQLLKCSLFFLCSLVKAWGPPSIQPRHTSMLVTTACEPATSITHSLAACGHQAHSGAKKPTKNSPGSMQLCHSGCCAARTLESKQSDQLHKGEAYDLRGTRGIVISIIQHSERHKSGQKRQPYHACRLPAIQHDLEATAR
jgi:hypothetical protein